MSSSYKPGQRVIILANKEEGWPEERGTFGGYSGRDLCWVAVDAEYLHGNFDDGQREIMISGIASDEH